MGHYDDCRADSYAADVMDGIDKKTLKKNRKKLKKMLKKSKGPSCTRGYYYGYTEDANDVIWRAIARKFPDDFEIRNGYKSFEIRLK